MALLKVQKLSFRYSSDSKFQLKNISFEIEKAQIASLIGVSGSGKSSLLKLIKGLADANEGALYLENEKITGPNWNLVPGHPEIELLHQDFDLFEFYNVRENISWFLKEYIPEFRNERTEFLLHFLDLKNIENNLPSQISGGQKQRLALARALARSPKLLLLDEPFSQLDAIRKNDLSKYLKKIVAQTDCSILMVSHDASDVLSISNRIFVLHNGQIIENGEPEQLFFEPKTLEAAQLTGFLFPLKNASNIEFTRPSWVQISNSKNDIEAEIVAISFLGFHYLIEAESNLGTIYFYYSQAFELGKKVSLKISKKLTF